jgi:proline utilization trans-activator
MNREFESGILSLSESEYRSRLWWTVYIIDRRLTASMGVPLLLHDADITLPIPPLPPGGDGQAAFLFHVRLSTQLGQVLRGTSLLPLKYWKSPD